MNCILCGDRGYIVYTNAPKVCNCLGGVVIQNDLNKETDDRLRAVREWQEMCVDKAWEINR